MWFATSFRPMRPAAAPTVTPPRRRCPAQTSSNGALEVILRCLQVVPIGHVGLEAGNRLADDGHRSVIVAVIAVWMVQVPIDEIVDVVAVGHRFVSAARAMYMAGIMSRATVVGRAAGRIRVADFQSVLFDLAVGADVMQVTVVQIVDMVAVLNARVFAVRAVLMVVTSVQISHHKAPYLGVDSSIACMTPLVTRREMCSSASA